jgi:hypothetical protein
MAIRFPFLRGARTNKHNADLIAVDFVEQPAV